jgi:hypothetical protein
MHANDDYTRNLATMEAPTRKVVGVKVCEVIEGVDVDKMKKLKYGLPNVNEYDIGDYLDFDELQIIAGDFGDTDYDNFTDEQKEWYNSSARHLRTRLRRIIQMLSLLILAINNYIHGKI